MKFMPMAVLFMLVLSVHAVQAQTTVKYVHTDALGSVVALTNGSGAVLEGRREYEPYGYQTTPAIQDGPGYTGHVQDVATGLVYMQQRYYDPGIGRFISVDPVTAHTNGDMRYFIRYAYAFNNPYSFIDPDGRCNHAINSLVGGVPCPLQQRNLNPAHVGADEAVARDAYLVALPMIAPPVGVATAAVGPTVIGGTLRAAGLLKDKNVRLACALGLAACNGGLKDGVENLGRGYGGVAEQLRGRAQTLGRMTERLRRDGGTIRPPPSGGAAAGPGATGTGIGSTSTTGTARPQGGFQGTFHVSGRLGSRRLKNELVGR